MMEIDDRYPISLFGNQEWIDVWINVNSMQVIDRDLFRRALGSLVDSHFRSKHSNTWRLTQGRNSTAEMGPSKAITESWFVVIVIVKGPSMEVIEDRIEVAAVWFEIKYGHL